MTVAPTSESVSLRIKLRYGDLDEFVDRYHDHISSAGLFLRTRSPKPTGTQIRFELSLENGTRALRGEGVVVHIRNDDKPGMALRFNLLDADSQAIVERIVSSYGQGSLAPTPLTNAFTRDSAQREATRSVRTHWRGRPGGRTGWVPMSSPASTSNSSKSSSPSPALPRQASRDFSITSTEPLADAPSAPASSDRRPLPRLRSSMLRPWSRSKKPTDDTASDDSSPGENIDRAFRRDPTEAAPAKPLKQTDLPTSVIGRKASSPFLGSFESTAELRDAVEIVEAALAATEGHVPFHTLEGAYTDPPTIEMPAPPEVISIHLPTVQDPEEVTPLTDEAKARAALSAYSREPLYKHTNDMSQEPKTELAEATVDDPPLSREDLAPSVSLPSKPDPIAPEVRVSKTQQDAIEVTPDRGHEDEEVTAPANASPYRGLQAPIVDVLDPLERTDRDTLNIPREDQASPSELDEFPRFATTVEASSSVVGTAFVPQNEFDPDEANISDNPETPEPVHQNEDDEADLDHQLADALAARASRAVLSTKDTADVPKTYVDEPIRDTHTDDPMDDDDTALVEESIQGTHTDDPMDDDDTALVDGTADLSHTLPIEEAPSGLHNHPIDHPPLLEGLGDNVGPETSVIESPEFLEGAHHDPLLSEIAHAALHWEDDGFASVPGDQTLRDELKRSSRNDHRHLPISHLAAPDLEDSPEAYADTADIAGRKVSEPDEETGLADTVDVPGRRSSQPDDHVVSPEVATIGFIDEDALPETADFLANVKMDGETDVVGMYRVPRRAPRLSNHPGYSTKVTVTGLSLEEAEKFRTAQQSRPSVAMNARTVVRSPHSEVQDPTAMRSGRLVGIDLGGRWARIGYIEKGDLELITAENSAFIPALIAVRADGSIVAGKQAQRIARVYPNRAASVRDILGGFGRDYGIQPANGKSPPVPMRQFAGQEVPIPELLRPFFNLLSRSIGRHLESTRCRAVLGVPSPWSPQAVAAAISSCRDAGIEIVKTITELDALVEAFNFKERDVEHLLVVDIGATHLAAMVARKKRSSFELIEWNWTDEVSAESIDDAIVELALKQLSDTSIAEGARHSIKEASEFARLDIYRTPQIELKFRPSGRRETTEATAERSLMLTRSDVYQATEPAVMDICRRVRALLQRAGVEPQTLDAVVAVGSAGQYPPFVEALTAIAQREPIVQYPAAQVCVVGLARRALALEREDSAQAENALRASIGIELPGGRFGPLVRVGSTLPLRLERQFPTTRDNQSELELRFFQGDAEFVRSCEPLGRLVLSGFPRGLRGEIRIRLSLTVDAEGVLKVRLQEPKSGAAEELTTATRQTPENTADLIRTRPRQRSFAPREEKKPGLLDRLFGRK